jgi:hypothetical protein
MANADASFGFKPVGNLAGEAEFVRVMTKDASDSTAIGIYGLVEHDGSANGVEGAVQGQTILGSSLAYGAASTLSTHPVVIHSASTILLAMEDSDTSVIAAADENLNADFIVTGTVESATTGLSGHDLDSSSAATTSTLDFNLLEPYADGQNTAASSYARWLVVPNIRRYGNQVVGA